jgi:hypothetical protein
MNKPSTYHHNHKIHLQLSIESRLSLAHTFMHTITTTA